MPKSEDVKEPKVTKVKHNQKVTSEDVPGSGMAKKAAKKMESYYSRQKDMLDKL
jgi:hypothetical protein